MTDQDSGPARPPNYEDISIRYGMRVWEARERNEELGRRDLMARTEARLRASGEWDDAQHEVLRADLLTVAERLELIAIGEYLARHFTPHQHELWAALKAGASLAEVAAALDCREAEAFDRIREWADGQNRLTHSPELARFGMPDEEYAALLARLDEGP